MSMQITIIFDTKEDLIRDLKGLLDTFLPPVLVHTVDTTQHVNYVEEVEAAPVVSETPAEAEVPVVPTPPAPDVSSVAASTPIPKLDEILMTLTHAFQTGEQSVKDRIVEVRNGLGLRFLSHAKDEHAEALHALTVELAQ